MWKDDRRRGGDLPRHRVSALRRLLRHADAPARRRVRRRHRQSPPAVRRCRGAAERLRRGHPVVPDAGRRRGAPARGRRDAVLRRCRSATYRVDELRARRRAAAVGRRRSGACRAGMPIAPSTRVADQLAGVLRRPAADRAPAHRGGSEARTRYTAEAMAGARRGRADAGRRARGPRGRGGAVGPQPGQRDDADGPREPNEPRGPGSRTTASVSTAAERRAGELRDDLRFLLRADDPDYVYFVEIRGRGLFLRASPIDVSRSCCDEALFDRFRTVVLTSATLAVDGVVRLREGTPRHPRRPTSCASPSEFDYTTPGAALPAAADAAAEVAGASREAAARETIELLTRSRGRAFVLFTSYAVLRTVQRVRARWRCPIRSSCRGRRRARR